MALSIIASVRDGLLHSRLLGVGGGMMAAMETRASLAMQGAVSWCPLSAFQAPPEQMSWEVETQHAQGARVIGLCHLDEQGASICLTQSGETAHTITARMGTRLQCWQELRLLVRSMAATRAVQANVQEHVQKVQQYLAKLPACRQGKPRLRTHAEVDEAIKAILKQFRVEGLLQGEIQEDTHEHPVRASRRRVSAVRLDLTFIRTSVREERAMAQTMRQLGWQVFATHSQAEHLTLEQAVEASRDAYLVKCTFTRPNGHASSLALLDAQRDDHSIGLVHLLTLALRVLAMLEGVLHHRLGERSEELAGLCAGHPQPTAKRVLVTLTVTAASGFAQRHVTPLSSLQQQILARCGCSPARSSSFANDSYNRPEMEAKGKSYFTVIISCPKSPLAITGARISFICTNFSLKTSGANPLEQSDEETAHPPLHCFRRAQDLQASCNQDIDRNSWSEVDQISVRSFFNKFPSTRGWHAQRRTFPCGSTVAR